MKITKIHLESFNGKQTQMLYSLLVFEPSYTFGTFFIQVYAPFETIRDCGFEW